MIGLQGRAIEVKQNYRRLRSSRRERICSAEPEIPLHQIEVLDSHRAVAGEVCSAVIPDSSARPAKTAPHYVEVQYAHNVVPVSVARPQQTRFQVCDGIVCKSDNPRIGKELWAFGPPVVSA